MTSKKKGFHGGTKRKRFEKKSNAAAPPVVEEKSVQRLMLQSISIFIAVMAVGFLLLKFHLYSSKAVTTTWDAKVMNTNNENRTKISELFELACNRTQNGVPLAQCNLDDFAFNDETRTVFAKRAISKDQTLIRILPELNLNIMTALGDPRIEKLLTSFPISDRSEKPPYVVIMSIYLVLEKNRLLSHNDDDLSPRDQFFRGYFNYIPTLENFLSFYPLAQKIFAMKDDFFRNGGIQEVDNLPFTPISDQMDMKIAREILYDYKKISERSSKDFESKVSFEDFAWAAMIIRTRCFKNGSPHGISVLPLMDFLNDKADANAHLNRIELILQMISAKDIEAGEELLFTYGDLEDQKRLHDYGYVKTNGFESSLATLAPYHPPDFASASTQLMKYLNFGDGYQECPNIEERKTDDGIFQHVKFQLLSRISKDLKYWVVKIPPSYNGKKKSLKVSKYAMTMCRLLALTHRDYDGEAFSVLHTMSSNPKATTLSSDSDSLEYRANHVLERLATETAFELRKILAPLMGRGEEEEINDIEVEVKRRLESKKLDPESPVGMRAHVLSTEVHSLQRIIAIAQKNKNYYLAKKQRKLDRGESVNEEDYVVRMKPCTLTKVESNFIPFQPGNVIKL